MTDLHLALGAPRLDRATTSARLATALIELIDERFEPGDRLPSERALCQAYGVGRTTLREALRTLQAHGRVDVQAGRGAYVTEPRPATPFSQWPERLEASVEELLQLRLLIEPAAAAMAALAPVPAATKTDALDAPLARMEAGIEADELERRVAADLAFHRAVAELSRNGIVLGVLEQLGTLLLESRRISLSYGSRLRRVQDAHTGIRDAIVAGDAARAADTMTAHLVAFARDMGLTDSRVVLPAGPMREISAGALAGPSSGTTDG